MAINEYDNPYVVPHVQTYKSQYVALPFAELQAHVDNKQSTFDSAELAEDAMRNRLLQVQALTKDKKLRNQLVNRYETEMIKNIEATGGDYGLAIPKIKAMGKELHTDLTRGQLGAISSNYAQAQTYNANLKEKYDKGDIDLEQLTGLQGISMHNYKGVQEQLQPEGIYNSFNGIEAANKVDIDAKVEAGIKGYMADKTDNGKWNMTADGRYRYHTKEGWKTVSATDVYRDISGMLQNDKEVMSYLGQQVQIEGYNAAMQGNPYDMTTSLQNKLHQYSHRAASKAGFTEQYQDVDKFKADEYMLDRFSQGLKFQYDNVFDDMQYRSEAVEIDNPLTHATNAQGEEVTGREAIQQNIKNWNKQGAAALKGLVGDLKDNAKTLEGNEFVEANAAITELEKILEGENGYIEAYKMLSDPARNEKLGFMGAGDETISKAIELIKPHMNNLADAKTLLRQSENAYMKQTGYDPQAYHNKGIEAAMDKAVELEESGQLPEGVTAEMFVDASFPMGENRYTIEYKPSKHSNGYSSYKLVDSQTGDTWNLGTKKHNNVTGLSNNTLMSAYNGANSKKDQELHANYESWTDNYIKEKNNWKSGGGNVSSMMPGDVQLPNGQWVHDEAQATKNTKMVRDYFLTNKAGNLNIGNWQGLRGTVMGPEGTESGNLMELVAKQLGFEYEDNWMATDEGKSILSDLKSSYPHLSQAATLRDNGQTRRFFEMKLNYQGKEATVKIPLGTDNISSSSINNMVNTSSENLRTRAWDLKQKGIERQIWDENPNVMFNMTEGKETVTMPNPNMGDVNHPDYGKSTVTVPFESALPYLSQFKDMKRAGMLDPSYEAELHEDYFNTQLAPQDQKVKLEQDLSFNSMTEFKTWIKQNPNSVEMNSVYFVNNPGGSPYRITGQDALMQVGNEGLDESSRKAKMDEEVTTLMNANGISEQRAREIVQKRHGRADLIHNMEDKRNQQQNDPNNIGAIWAE